MRLDDYNTTLTPPRTLRDGQVLQRSGSAQSDVGLAVLEASVQIHFQKRNGHALALQKQTRSVPV